MFVMFTEDNNCLRFLTRWAAGSCRSVSVGAHWHFQTAGFFHSKSGIHTRHKENAENTALFGGLVPRSLAGVPSSLHLEGSWKCKLHFFLFVRQVPDLSFVCLGVHFRDSCVQHTRRQPLDWTKPD